MSDPTSAYVPAVVYSDHAAPEFLYETPPGADLDHGPATDPDATALMVRNAGRNLAAGLNEQNQGTFEHAGRPANTSIGAPPARSSRWA